MKKLFLCFLLLSGTVFAQNCCNYCCPGEKLFWAEALYFKPATFNFDYVVVDPAANKRVTSGDNDFFGPVGKERGECPDYEWGFRLGIRTDLDCNKIDAKLTYSRLCAHTNQTTKAKGQEALWPTFGYGALFRFGTNFLVNGEVPAFAKNNFKERWNAVDAEVGYKSRKKGCLLIRANAGLHWTSIRIERDLFYQGTEPDFDNTYCSSFSTGAETWGIGPRFGGQACYDLGCCFNFEARAGLGILAGGTRNTLKGEALLREGGSGDISESGFIKIHNPCRCVIFPELDAYLGINYLAFCNNCLNLSLGLGWEFRTYVNAFSQQYYTTNGGTGLHATSSDSFSLQGLSIRGTLRF